MKSFKTGDEHCVLVARVSNDTLSDLIQREAGHIFKESGDNYLFMIEPILIKTLKQELHCLVHALRTIP